MSYYDVRDLSISIFDASKSVSHTSGAAAGWSNRLAKLGSADIVRSSILFKTNSRERLEPSRRDERSVEKRTQRSRGHKDN